MPPETIRALKEAAEWLGDAHPLVEQLGSTDGLVEMHGLSESLQSRPVTDLGSLRNFLVRYHLDILVPHELPAIRTAHGHAAGGELRELVAFDKQLAEEPALKDFSRASKRVGLSQLQKLRPLRDERIVQRYLHAVEEGEANGWHTVVYGLTLAVYSLPLRQGLLRYAQQTIRGFIHASAKPLKLTEETCHKLLLERNDLLPPVIESLLVPVKLS